MEMSQRFKKALGSTGSGIGVDYRTTNFEDNEKNEQRVGEGAVNGKTNPS